MAEENDFRWDGSLPVEGKVVDEIIFGLPKSKAKNSFDRLTEIVKHYNITRVTLLSGMQTEATEIDGQCRLYENGFEAVTMKRPGNPKSNVGIGKSKAFLYVDRHPKQSIKVDYMF